MKAEKLSIALAIIAIIISAYSIYCMSSISAELSGISSEMKRISSDVDKLKGAPALPALSGKVIKVGVLTALTGPLAKDGLTLRRAVEMAVEEINSAGGVLGASILPIFEDHGTDPKVAAAAAEKLITVDNVNVLVGGLTSSCAMAILEVAEKYSIPYLCDASADDLTAKGYRYIFRTASNSTENALLSVRFIKEVLEPKLGSQMKIAILHENTLMGTQMANKFREEVERKNYGWKIVCVYPYEGRALDFKPMLRTVMATNPDLVVMSPYLTDGVLIAQQMKELNWSPFVYCSGGGFMAPDFLSMAGENVLGWFGNFEYYYDKNYPDRSLSRQIFLKFKERYGLYFETKAYNAYLAINLIAVAVEKSGSLVPGKIADTLRETDITIPWLGRVRFFDNGHRDNTQNIVVVQIQKATSNDLWQGGGVTYRVIYPEIMKVGEPILP